MSARVADKVGIELFIVDARDSVRRQIDRLGQQKVVRTAVFDVCHRDGPRRSERLLEELVRSE